MVLPPVPPIPKTKLPRYGPLLTRCRSHLLPGDQDAVSSACSSKSGFGRRGRKVVCIKSSSSLDYSSISGIASIGSSITSMRSNKSQKKVADVEPSSTQSMTVNKDPTVVPATVVHIEKEEARESNDNVSRTVNAPRATKEPSDGVAVLNDQGLEERCPAELPVSRTCDENSEKCGKADEQSSSKFPVIAKSNDTFDMTKSFNEPMVETVRNDGDCHYSICHCHAVAFDTHFTFLSNSEGQPTARGRSYGQCNVASSILNGSRRREP